jgi:lipid-binding SYLF domain-containing protein
MKIKYYGIITLALAAFSAQALADDSDIYKLTAQVQDTRTAFQQQFPGWANMFQSSAGYAVFPSVSEGALGVGVLRGTGLLYESGRATGKVAVTKGSIGLQAGGQNFSEIIFFQTPEALQEFRAGNYELKAGISGTATYEGAGSKMNYNQGLSVVTFGKTGLIGKISVGGQKFSYEPLPPATTRERGCKTPPSPKPGLSAQRADRT